MPSRESVSEEVRAKTEFTTAVRNGIEALMGRCGYSRERATLALLKELNRGTGAESKPTDNEMFDTMRRYKLGLDEANRAIVVSRAMRREMLSQKAMTPTEAIQRLTSRLSLDNILYESGEDDSDDDGQNEILPLNIPKISRVSSSASINLSSSSSSTSSTNTTTHSTSSSRKHARSKKTSPSKSKQMKANLIRTNSNNATNTIIVGRKRSIEEIDSSKQSSEVETKAATGRPQLRASKRLHTTTNK
mmetsp:Transcript_14417/g.36218  ORF Transcript_14417/g.36218 Transcript_14417/m.36218 type:complete len:247 (+) Transcript_14417:460-1200(+)|eukprot:CAMPEP_0116096286 /NCGR_PEP_ID=MMETSP0327-20121206/10104_1 /TAXON_ID=44447 /ORGANISM="Pseudo-nitzschia delicatissima, Strain B596" /LENGTH=246 /DNA_ID=CAMNT_0003587987 /DNA_START=403 /DNA_END=1143 /DNA_ORIENTATION=-